MLAAATLTWNLLNPCRSKVLFVDWHSSARTSVAIAKTISWQTVAHLHQLKQQSEMRRQKMPPLQHPVAPSRQRRAASSSCMCMWPQAPLRKTLRYSTMVLQHSSVFYKRQAAVIWASCQLNNTVAHVVMGSLCMMGWRVVPADIEP